MSINWVMLSETQGFVPLPGERILYTSPPRTTLALQTPNKYPGKEPLSIHSSAGCVHLTNQRVVYLPASPSPQLQSFSAPILNLHDTHVSAPFFGPNVWTGILQPVPGGGIPPQHAVVEIRMVFKDGGAFDFHSQFERIKERLQNAIEVARESGTMSGDGSAQLAGRGGGPLAGVSLAGVHLDELPAYAPGEQEPLSTQGLDGEGDQSSAHQTPSTCNDSFSPPTEPPPGYEEVQSQSVADELERRLRASN